MRVFQRFFSRSHVTDLSIFSSPLFFSLLVFNHHLRKAANPDFAHCMTNATLGSLGACAAGAVTGFVLNRFFKSSSETTQAEENDRQERQRMGYRWVTRELFVEGVRISFPVMTVMFLMRSAESRFDYGHFLVAGAWASVTATASQTVWLMFTDRLRRSAPLST